MFAVIKTGGKQYKVQEGDILLSIGKRKLLSKKEFKRMLREYASEETLTVEVLRKGKKLNLSVQAAEFPQALAMDLSYRLLGIRVKPLSEARRYRYKNDDEAGVVISEIRPDSYLSRIGVRPGDVIRRIDEIVIHRVDDFEKTIVKYRNKPSMVIYLERADQLYTITVNLS